jgi:hypothetical protein
MHSSILLEKRLNAICPMSAKQTATDRRHADFCEQRGARRGHSFAAPE